MDALPYIDLIDPAEIDLLLISQSVSVRLTAHLNFCPCIKTREKVREVVLGVQLEACFLPPSFHLDHCGALPWFLQKTSFKGRTFMTHATKAIYRWLLSDYVKVRWKERAPSGGVEIAS